MILRFNEHEVVLEDPVRSDAIVAQLNEWLGHAYYFSGLVIDGRVIEGDPDEAVSLYGSTAELIELQAIPAAQFVNDVLLSTEEYVQRATPLLQELAEQFYDDVTEESWHSLNDIFVGLQWLHSMIVTVDQSIVRPTDWGALVEEVTPLQAVLPDFEQALEHGDTVLIGDLLSYEVQPVFEQLSTRLTSIIDAEGERDGIH